MSQQLTPKAENAIIDFLCNSAEEARNQEWLEVFQSVDPSITEEEVCAIQSDFWETNPIDRHHLNLEPGNAGWREMVNDTLTFMREEEE